MSNQLTYFQRYHLLNWVKRRIADVCRCGSRRMAILAGDELGFTVTHHNMLSIRRITLDWLQQEAEKKVKL